MRARRAEQAGLAGDATRTPQVPTRREAPAPDAGTARPDERARSREEAEARFAVAHDAWIVAMRGASSGKPADLARLAIAQATYEVAAAERELWASSRVTIPVHPDDGRKGIDAVVGQELAWRRIHDAGRRRLGLMGRLARRFRRRGSSD